MSACGTHGCPQQVLGSSGPKDTLMAMPLCLEVLGTGPVPLMTAPRVSPTAVTVPCIPPAQGPLSRMCRKAPRTPSFLSLGS